MQQIIYMQLWLKTAILIHVWLSCQVWTCQDLQACYIILCHWSLLFLLWMKKKSFTFCVIHSVSVQSHQLKYISLVWTSVWPIYKISPWLLQNPTSSCMWIFINSLPRSPDVVIASSQYTHVADPQTVEIYHFTQ